MMQCGAFPQTSRNKFTRRWFWEASNYLMRPSRDMLYSLLERGLSPGIPGLDVLFDRLWPAFANTANEKVLEVYKVTYLAYLIYYSIK